MEINRLQRQYRRDQWKSCFLWKDKFDKPFTTLNKKKRKGSCKKNEKLQCETEIQRIIEYYEQLAICQQIVPIWEMDKILESYNLPRLNHKEIEKSE